jgi:hypothetical protein
MDNAQISGQAFFIPPNTEQYKKGYDETFGEPQENPELVALRAEMAEMRKVIEAAGKVSTVVAKQPKSTNGTAAKVAMACGKEIYLKGQRMHRKTCTDGCEPMPPKE